MANTYHLASSTGMTATDATLFQAEQNKAIYIVWVVSYTSSYVLS